MNWDDYFFGIAEAVSRKSTCLKRHYGAVLVNQQHRTMSTGYNAPPPGVKHCKECRRKDSEPGKEYDKCPSIHAEENCLLFSGWEKANKSTLYLYGEIAEACRNCKKIIINCFVSKVKCFDGKTMVEFNPKDWVGEI